MESKNRFKLARTIYNQHGQQSVREVAKITGITGSLIDDLESNAGKARDVGYSKIVKLAKHYGVSSDYLLGLSEIPSVDEDIKVAFKITGLSEKAINALNGADRDELDFISFLIENRISSDISTKAYGCAIDKSIIKALDKRYSTVGLGKDAVRKMIRESDDVRKAFNEVKRLQERVDTRLWRCHKILESAIESFIDYILEREENNGKH